MTGVTLLSIVISFGDSVTTTQKSNECTAEILKALQAHEMPLSIAPHHLSPI
jgi:hypothetical protein